MFVFWHIIYSLAFHPSNLTVVGYLPSLKGIKFNFSTLEIWALTKIENQLILGRDPDYAISKETTNFGDSFSIIINTHISRVEKLNLIPLRGGKYPITYTVDGGIANE